MSKNTTAPRMQQLLGALAANPSGPNDSHDPAAAAFAAALKHAAAPGPGWDPSDVWLRRVHEPRLSR
ncbi:MAG: hypothetical protein ACR2I8_05540, partial [Steroidobacteraceae bacterium]